MGAARDAREKFAAAVDTYTSLQSYISDSNSAVHSSILRLHSILKNRNPNRNGFGSHLRLLLSAIAVTDGAILETGIGDYSTLAILDVISSHRFFLSAETDRKWLEKYMHTTRAKHQLLMVPVYSDGIGCFNVSEQVRA